MTVQVGDANFIVAMVSKLLSMKNKWISLSTKFLFFAQKKRILFIFAP